MFSSHIAIRARDFTDVVEWQHDRSKQDTLHIYGNDEVDLAALSRIVESGRWDEMRSVYGFFAGVYETKDRVHLFCDRLGIYPLFYYQRQGRIYASPSVPDLLRAGQLKRKPCMEGVISLLLFGHHLADETVLEEIKRCNGGTTVKIGVASSNGDRICWNGRHLYQDAPSVEASELAELFVREVERGIGHRQQVSVALSGGFDSRAVLGALLECVAAERIRTLTFGDKDSYDRQIAELVAKKAGVKNRAFSFEDHVFDDHFLRERSGNYGYGYSAFATQPKEMLSHIAEISSRGCPLFWGVGGDAITGSHLRVEDLSLNTCDGYESFARLLIEKRHFLSLRNIGMILGLDERQIVRCVADLLERSPLGQRDKPWQWLDSWDIFTRGRMETIGVLPFDGRSWRCPHLGQEYFGQMSTRRFEEKLGQSIYKNMLSSRFKFLFTLPTKRLKGKSLTGGQWQNLYWDMRWRAGRVGRFLNTITGRAVDSAGRNYAKNNRFLRSNQGRGWLQCSIDTLLEHYILKANADDIFRVSQTNRQASLMLITLGHAFDRS